MSDIAQEKGIIKDVYDVSEEPVSRDVVPKPKIPFRRSTLFQAWVLAAVFFCGPGMYAALNSLGAGGLRSPLLVNITSGISFGMNAILALFTGIAINIFGVKAVLSFGVIGFSINGAALYCNNRFETTWLLYFSSVLQGFCTSVLWVVQGAIMLAYPEADFKGTFSKASGLMFGNETLTYF